MMGDLLVMRLPNSASMSLCHPITCFTRSIGSLIYRICGAHLALFYISMGRPSVDPELMIRVRSELRLCEDVHLNLAYRWFCTTCIKQRDDCLRYTFNGLVAHEIS